MLVFKTVHDSTFSFHSSRECKSPNTSCKTTESFYYLDANLYLVKTPENGADSKSCIEDLFDPELLKTPIGEKQFDPSKEHDADGKYGKVVFAKQVVRPNADNINFSRFGKLLERIAAVLDDYEKRKSSSVGS